MQVLKKLPDVIGFYLPGDRRQDYDGRVADKHGELVYQPSMTKQSFKDECDINNIVRDFTPQGLAALTLQTFQQGTFQDLPDSVDYQQALEIARSAEAAFAQLPAQVRARFDNSAERFLDFMQDPANQDEAIKLGLATDTRPLEPPKPPPAPPPQDGSAGAVGAPAGGVASS